MREILFKAKRKDNGEWVYGNYAFADTFGGKHWIFQNKAFDHEVEPNTICQYTGLTDKNGNKIWENDVVCTPYVDPIFGDMVDDKILDDYTWKVVFIDGGFCVKNECKRINLRSFTNGNNIKLAGNIFDNPELLSED